MIMVTEEEVKRYAEQEKQTDGVHLRAVRSLPENLQDGGPDPLFRHHHRFAGRDERRIRIRRNKVGGSAPGAHYALRPESRPHKPRRIPSHTGHNGA